MMTIEQIIELAKTRGPWAIDRRANQAIIRNPKGECPIHAAAIAAGGGLREITGAFSGSDFLEFPDELRNAVISAADFERSDVLELREQLIKELIEVDSVGDYIEHSTLFSSE